MSSDSERDLTGSDDSEPDIEIELRVDPSDEIGSSSRGQKKKKKNKYRTCIGRQTIVNLVVNLLEEAMASQPTEPPSVSRCHTWKAARTRRDSNDPKKVVPVNEDEMDKMPDTGDLASDPIARRFGPEYPGGVTPSTVNLTIHNERRYMQLSHDYRISLAEREELRRRMSSMEREMAEIKELVRDCTCSTPRDQELATQEGPREPVSQRPSDFPRHAEMLPNQPELHGRRCVLLHYDTPDEVIVAEAQILETDPAARCRDIRLGRMFYRVQVDRVVEGYESLELPVGEFDTLSSVLQSFIPWTRQHIRLI